MKKKPLVLVVVFIGLVIAAGIYSSILASKGFTDYLDFETRSQHNELDFIGTIKIVHATDQSGLYAWLGDRDEVTKNLSKIESSEDTAYEETKRFILPFTYAAKMKDCIEEVHELRAIDIAAIRQVIATRTGSDALVDRALKSFNAYLGSSTQCQLTQYVHQHHLDEKSAQATNSKPIPSGLNTSMPPVMPKQASPAPTSVISAAAPPVAPDSSGIERDYDSLSNKIHETKSSAEITQADIAALADILAHPSSVADWQYLAKLDSSYADPANSCDTGDCAIAESIVEQAEQSITKAGLHPPDSTTAHFKLGQP